MFLFILQSLIIITLSQECPAEGHYVGTCGKCVYNSQCAADEFCCPYMKLCVPSSSHGCPGPIAVCSPTCHETSFGNYPNSCNCNNPSFPNDWVDCEGMDTDTGGDESGGDSTPSTGGDPADDPTIIDSEEWLFLDLLNQMRAEAVTCGDGTHHAANPVPLLMDCALHMASYLHSQDMADNNYFDHNSQDGRSPWDRAAEQGTTANAENIAAGNSGAEATLQQWRDSNGHCNNMLNNNYKRMGVGRAYQSASMYRWYWTLMLANDENFDDSCYLGELMLSVEGEGLDESTKDSVCASVAAELGGTLLSCTMNEASATEKARRQLQDSGTGDIWAEVGEVNTHIAEAEVLADDFGSSLEDLPAGVTVTDVYIIAEVIDGPTDTETDEDADTEEEEDTEESEDDADTEESEDDAEEPADDTVIDPSSDECNVGHCGQCVYDHQCPSGEYCCPYMKKCVANGRDGCYSPIANCNTCSCYETNADYPDGCSCQSPDFPDNWVTCLSEDELPSEEEEEDDDWPSFPFLDLLPDDFVPPLLRGDSPTLMPTESDVPQTCVSITLTTKRWGDEIEYEIGGSCSGSGFGNFGSYDDECCFATGSTVVLKCIDSYGDGWHGASIAVGTESYCGNFNSGSLMTKDITITADSSSDSSESMRAILEVVNNSSYDNIYLGFVCLGAASTLYAAFSILRRCSRTKYSSIPDEV